MPIGLTFPQLLIILTLVLLVLAFADAVADRIQATVGALYLHGDARGNGVRGLETPPEASAATGGGEAGAAASAQGPSEPPERA